MLPATTWAAEDAKPAASSKLDTDKDGKISGAETKALMEKDATVGDVVKDTVAAVDAAKEMKGKSGTALALAICGFLAVLFKGLLSLLKVLAKNTGWFDGARGKAALKYSTLGLGALAAAGAGIAMALGADLAWWDVVIIGVSGPGSMVAHELMSLAPGVGKHASVPDPDAGA